MIVLPIKNQRCNRSLQNFLITGKARLMSAGSSGVFSSWWRPSLGKIETTILGRGWIRWFDVRRRTTR